MYPKTLLLCFLPVVLAQELRILHRIHDPLALNPAPYTERGQLSLTGSASSATLLSTESLGDDLLEFAESAHSLEGDVWYQVALEREGDAHAGHWATSAVKAVCINLVTALSALLTSVSRYSAIWLRAHPRPSSFTRVLTASPSMWTSSSPQLLMTARARNALSP